MNGAAPTSRARLVAAAAVTAVGFLSWRIGLANFLFSIGLLAAIVAWRRGELRGLPPGRRVLLPVAALIATALLSAVFSLDPLASLGKLPLLVTLLLVPLAALLIDATWWRRLVLALAVSTTVLAVWGFVQYAQGADNLAQRIQGPLSHYMTYSGLLLQAVLVLVAEVAVEHRGRAWWLLPPAVLGTVAILLSLTRNAWVGLAVGLLLLAAVWRRRLLLVYPVLAVLIWLAAPTAVLDRAVTAFDLRQHANYDRLCMAISGVQMLRDHPWVGVGLDMVPRLYPLYRRDDAPRWRVPHLHNNPLQIAAERGVGGLAAYLWLLAAFFATTWRALPRLAGAARAPVAAALVAVAGISAAGLFEYNFGDAEVQYLTLILIGAGAAAAERGAT